MPHLEIRKAYLDWPMLSKKRGQIVVLRGAMKRNKILRIIKKYFSLATQDRIRFKKPGSLYI
jgi:hypothetical protein